MRQQMRRAEKKTAAQLAHAAYDVKSTEEE